MENNRTKENEVGVDIDRTASIHTIEGDSELGSCITSTTDCRVRAKALCGTSVARKHAKLYFQSRSTHGELVNTGLEALIVPGLGGNLLSVGALKEKGLKFDLLQAQTMLKCGRHAFLICTDGLRIYSTSST